MEAMWMRFNPLVQELREQVQNEELGPVHFFTANLGYRTATSRLNNADPGRDALLNFGVCGISLAHFLFGPPFHFYRTIF
jgi:predicted dehydrogenase